jgi:hypothetical protein
MSGKKGGGGAPKPAAPAAPAKPAAPVFHLADIIHGLIPGITGAVIGKAADKAEEGAKVAMGPTSAFMSWWPREVGEPLLSVSNLGKFAAILVGLGLYKKVDPFPGSKADNVAVYGLAAYLTSQLIVERKNDMGSHFGSFEGNLFVGLAAKDFTSLNDVMDWVNSLDHRQERQLAEMLGPALDDKTPEAATKTAVLAALADPTVRDMLSRTLDKKPISSPIMDVLTSPAVLAADQKAAEVLADIRAKLPWLRK